MTHTWSCWSRLTKSAVERLQVTSYKRELQDKDYKLKMKATIIWRFKDWTGTPGNDS